MGLLKERGTLLTGEWQDNKKSICDFIKLPDKSKEEANVCRLLNLGGKKRPVKKYLRGKSP